MAEPMDQQKVVWKVAEWVAPKAVLMVCLLVDWMDSKWAMTKDAMTAATMVVLKA